MKVWKKLQNPFALVGQGFVAGAVLFWASQSQAGPHAPTVSSPPSSLSSF
jgi:hypothetical protein